MNPFDLLLAPPRAAGRADRPAGELAARSEGGLPPALAALAGGGRIAGIVAVDASGKPLLRAAQGVIALIGAPPLPRGAHLELEVKTEGARLIARIVALNGEPFGAAKPPPQLPSAVSPATNSPVTNSPSPPLSALPAGTANVSSAAGTLAPGTPGGAPASGTAAPAAPGPSPLGPQPSPATAGPPPHPSAGPSAVGLATPSAHAAPRAAGAHLAGKSLAGALSARALPARMPPTGAPLAGTQAGVPVPARAAATDRQPPAGASAAVPSPPPDTAHSRQSEPAAAPQRAPSAPNLTPARTTPASAAAPASGPPVAGQAALPASLRAGAHLSAPRGLSEEAGIRMMADGRQPAALDKRARAAPTQEALPLPLPAAREASAPLRPIAPPPAGRSLWPALARALETLERQDPALAARHAHETVPGPRRNLLSLLHRLTAAFAAPAAREEPTGSLARLLEGWGRSELAAEITREWGQLVRLAGENDPGQWRLYLLPFGDGGGWQPLRLFTRREGGGEAEEDAGTRFVVEVELSRLGPIQLDGMANGRRFRLVLRSRSEIAGPARQAIEALVEETGALSGASGTVLFQTVDAFPIEPMREIAAGRADDLSV